MYESPINEAFHVPEVMVPTPRVRASRPPEKVLVPVFVTESLVIEVVPK